MHVVVLAIALACSSLAFVLMALDKRAARSAKRRIREVRFATLAALGGWPGILAGGLAFRHKTQSYGFQAKVVLGALVHLGIAWLVWPIEP